MFCNSWWYAISCYNNFVTWEPAPMINTLRPRQNGRHFPDNTFRHIFWNENGRISIKFSLKFVSKGPLNKIPALVQLMAWCRPGDKPLSQPMMVRLLMHICVTRPQWVNTILGVETTSVITQLWIKITQLWHYVNIIGLMAISHTPSTACLESNYWLQGLLIGSKYFM